MSGTTAVVEEPQFNFLHYDGKLWPFDPKRIIYMDPYKVNLGHVVVAKAYRLPIGPGDKYLDVPIVLQGPKSVAPFGIGQMEDTKIGGKPKEDAKSDVEASKFGKLSLSLTLAQSTARQKAWLKLLRNWDEMIPSIILANRSKWLANPDVSDEAIRIFYSPIVRKCKRKKADGSDFAPRFSVKVDPSSCVILDKADQAAAWTDVVAQSQVVPAISYSGIYFGERIISNRFKADLIKFTAPAPTISRIVPTEQDDEL